jgi:TonB-dependent receptor
VDFKNRDFNARSFGYKNIPGGSFAREDSILQLSVGEIFDEKNISPNFIQITEITKPSDSYQSNQNIFASYFAFDFSLFEKIKLITGVRYEYSKQELSSGSLTGEPIKIAPEYFDLLPSINLTIQPIDQINIRLAYTKTLARPEFREIAPFSYFDFLENEIVQGNTELKRTSVTNYDLRFEYYPSRAADMFAVGLFYKNFADPIEQVFLPSSSFEPIRGFKNANSANNYGIELEIRKSLDFIHPALFGLALIGNVSYIKSEVEFQQGNAQSSYQEATRPMQGQAEYVINAGLYYDNFDAGFSASFVYNKVGQKILKVGFAGLGDVIEVPRDQIDFSVSQRLMESLTLKFSVRDLLAQDYLAIQKSPLGDKVSNRIKKGNDISLGVSYKF